MRTYLKTVLSATLIIASAALTFPAFAQTTAIGFTANFQPAESTASFDFSDPDTGAYDESASYVLGWTFTAQTPLIVTQLGFFTDPTYYDPNNPYYSDPNQAAQGTQTYAQSHAIGLYTADGTLLMSATVTQTDPLVGNYFRYAAPTLAPGVTSFTLTPGSTYVIAGVTGADDPYLSDVIQPNGTSALTVDPALIYGQGVFTSGASLTDFPDQSDPISGPSFFGPDFRFTTPTAAPEPSPLAVFALTLPIFAWQAYRRLSKINNR